MDNSFLKEVQQRRKRDLAVLEGLNAKIKVMQMEADLVQQAVSAYDNILGNGSTNGGQRQQRVVTGGRKGSRKSGGLNKTTVLI